MLKIDLYSRFGAAFGVAANTAMSRAYSEYLGTNMKLFDNQNRQFADVKLIHKTTEYNFINQELESGTSFVPLVKKSTTFSANVLAPPPMLTFSRTKNIVTTVIDNSDFEVLESFGKRGWDITMSGILVDMQEHWYPGDLLAKLRELFDIDDTLRVVGDVFDDLKITEVYIDSLTDLSFVEGFNDTIKYTLNLKSTRSAEATIF